MSLNLKAWLKDFTADLNQPAFKTIVFAVLTVGTAVSFWVAMQVRVWTGYCKLGETLYAICRGDLQEEVFWGWLAFLAAGWGITFLDYRTKRNTTFAAQTPTPEAERQEREPPPPPEAGG